MAEKLRRTQGALSKRKRLFVEYYLESWNAAEAAVRAGYSERSKYEMDHRLLNDPVVAEALRRRVETQCMSADEALIRLAEQARNEGSAYLRNDGTLDFAALKRDEKLHLIKSVKKTRFGLNIEFVDAQAALIQIGKVHALFQESLDLTSKGDKIIVNLVKDNGEGD
jgi:phage terminase small subunit